MSKEIYILMILMIAVLSVFAVLLYKNICYKKTTKRLALEGEVFSPEMVNELLEKGTYDFFVRVSHDSEKRNSPISEKTYEEFINQGQGLFICQDVVLTDDLLERRHKYV